MPRKKRGDNRGSSPEKVLQSGPKPRVGHQYGGTTGDVWSEVGKKGVQIGQGLTTEQEKIYFELQEMFAGVDGEVIYVVLTESEWRVDEAVEKLLVLGQDHTTTIQEANYSLQDVAQSIRQNTNQHSSANHNLRSRLPSTRISESDQLLPSLSPKTPNLADANQHPLLMGSGNVPGGGNIHSAMEAIGSYANNNQEMLTYLHGYPDQATTYNPALFDMGSSNIGDNTYNSNQGLGLETLTQNYSGNGQSLPLDVHASTDVGFPPCSTDSGYEMINNPYHQKQGMFSSESTESNTMPESNPDVNYTSNSSVPRLGNLGSTHKPPDAHKRKGHRKKTLSLNPEEREALENLIEDVIIGGVGGGVIDSEESTSSESEEDVKGLQQPQFENTNNKQLDKTQDSSSGSDKEKPQKGKKGKQGKDGKVYPAQLKVAVKHMKNLPPRFLKRLQTAEDKKKEANLKNADGTLSEQNVSEITKQIEILTIKEQPEKEAKERDFAYRERDKQKYKQEQLKETKQKIRNMLDDLDQYEDEENKAEEKEPEQEKPNSSLQTPTSPPSTLQATSPAPQAPTSPNNQIMNMCPQQGLSVLPDFSTSGPASPHAQTSHPYSYQHSHSIGMAPLPQQMIYTNAKNCEDLERELLQGYDPGGGGGLNRSDQSAFATPPSVRRSRAQGSIHHPGTLNQLQHSQQYFGQSSQFSVNAPEFVPRSYTPTSLSQTQVPVDPLQVMQSGMIPMPNFSQPPPVFNISVTSSAAYHMPMGRMSPQMSNVSIGNAGLCSPSGRGSMHSAMTGYSVSDTITTTVPSTGQVQGTPSFMIPKVQQNMGSGQALPPQPGVGVGLIPFNAYPPPNMAAYGAYQGPVYPQQYPFRPPFLPHLGFGWAKDNKSPNKQFGHPPNPRMNSQGKHPGLKDKKGLLGQNGRSGVGNSAQTLQSSSVSGLSGARKTAQATISAENAKQKIQNLINEGKKVLVLLRGCPGSGKSSLAKEIVLEGIILSTDDYFLRNGIYEHDYGNIGEPHAWNQKRAKEAIEAGKSPVIIDNTNTQAWEMKAYVVPALNNNYHVEIFEPDNSWRLKPKELAKRNTHGVSLEVIQNMVDRFEHNVTLERILGIKSKKTEESNSKTQDNSATEQPAPTKKARKKKKKKRKKDRKKKIEKSGEAADDESSGEDGVTDRELSQEKEPESKESYIKEDISEVMELTGSNFVQKSLDNAVCNGDMTIPQRRKDVKGNDSVEKENSKNSSNCEEVEEIYERKNINVDIMPTITEDIILESSVIGSDHLGDSELVDAKYTAVDTDKMKSESVEEEKILIKSKTSDPKESTENCCLEENATALDEPLPGTIGAEQEMKVLNKENLSTCAVENIDEDDNGVSKKALVEVSQSRLSPQGGLGIISEVYNTSESSGSPTSPKAPALQCIANAYDPTVSVCESKIVDASDALDKSFGKAKALLNKLHEQSSEIHMSNEKVGTSGISNLTVSCDVLPNPDSSVELTSGSVIQMSMADIGVNYWNSEKPEANPYNISLLSSDTISATFNDSQKSAEKLNMEATDTLELDAQVGTPHLAALPQKQQKTDQRKTVKAGKMEANLVTDEMQLDKESMTQVDLTRPGNGRLFSTNEDMVDVKNKPTDTTPQSLEETIKHIINESLEDRKFDLSQLPKSLLSTYTGDEIIEGFKGETTTEASTGTESMDFVITYKVTNGQGLTNDERSCIQAVLLCLPREIHEGPTSDMVEEQSSPSRPLRFKIHQSCSTSDLAEPCTINDMEFLTSCFPTVTQGDLSDILQQCGGDLEWAVNLMLDAGYEYNDPNHNNIEIDTTDETTASNQDQDMSSVELPQGAEPGMDKDILIGKQEKTKSKISPSPLLVICHDSLKSKGAITEKQYREFADKSLGRLRGIDEFQHTLTKPCMTYDENVVTPSLVKGLPRGGAEDTATRPRLDLSKVSRSLDASGDQNTLFDTANAILSPEATQAIRRQQSQAEEDPDPRDRLQEEDENSTGNMVLTLNPQLAQQLINTFGPVGFHISPDSLGPDDYKVRLNRQTAKNIHRRWALTMQEKFTLEEAAIHKMMAEDEEFARRLQEEEMLSVVPTPVSYPSQTRSTNPSKISRGVVNMPSPPENLRDIMEEEMVIEASKQEYLDTNSHLQVNEGTLSARLKRQKLGAMYPGIDSSVLDGIFQSTGCSLEDTVYTIQESTGDSPAPTQTVYNGKVVSDVEYEEILVKRAIDESLENQWLGVGSDMDPDFQGMDDPDYHDFRAEASMHYRLRQELFQKAQEAYRRGMKSVASFYSQQGHLHTEKLREANHRAAEKILAHSNQLLHGTNSVDLHGLHISEALDALQKVISRKESEVQQEPDKRKHHLSVITGRGNRSRGGVARIKPAVIDFLKRNGYSFQEVSEGMIKVLVKHNG